VLCDKRAHGTEGQKNHLMRLSHVDFYLSETRERDAAKRFLQTALADPDNRPPRVFSVDGNRSYGAAIRELHDSGQFVTKCRYGRSRYRNNRIESDHRHIKRRWRAMQGARTLTTARALIEGMEAADDQKRSGARDPSAQPPWTGLALRRPPRSRVTPEPSLRSARHSARNLQHFPPDSFLNRSGQFISVFIAAGLSNSHLRESSGSLHSGQFYTVHKPSCRRDFLFSYYPRLRGCRPLIVPPPYPERACILS
jgi:hypothetical protein